MIQQEVTATQTVVPGTMVAQASPADHPEVLQRACAGCSARLTQAIVPTFPEDTVGLSRHSSPPTEPAGHPPAAWSCVPAALSAASFFVSVSLRAA